MVTSLDKNVEFARALPRLFPRMPQATIPNFLLFSSVLDFVLVCKVFGVVPFLSWCISAVSKEKFAMQGFYLPEAFTYI